ncbi:MAG: nucleoside deaminase [Defluviitaleaceae bacterium]|nr:nucleoside deaminase [Defluviitaleaceae bacterium]
MWNNLEKGFQIAFEIAWEAYKSGTTPIGSAILSQTGELMATGQNQIYSKGEGLISLHQIAHAEINAILKLSEITDQNIKDNIRKFTLYSTMEPCPLCFGAITMGSIRNVKFAARDNCAGGTAINNSIDYIKNKKITVTGPLDDAETVQIAIQTAHELRGINDRIELYENVVFKSWMEVCEKGVTIGRHLYKNQILEKMASCDFGEVYNLILSIDVA